MGNNDDRLRPLGDGSRTVEEERKIQSAGGKASGEARRKKRAMRDAARALLSMEISPTQSGMKAILKALGIPESENTYQAVILAAQLIKAANGDTKAAEFVRDTAGQNPATIVREKQLALQKQMYKEQKAKEEGANEIPDDGFLDALKGKIDNSDWNEAE